MFVINESGVVASWMNKRITTIHGIAEVFHREDCQWERVVFVLVVVSSVAFPQFAQVPDIFKRFVVPLWCSVRSNSSYFSGNASRIEFRKGVYDGRSGNSQLDDCMREWLEVDADCRLRWSTICVRIRWRSTWRRSVMWINTVTHRIASSTRIISWPPTAFAMIEYSRLCSEYSPNTYAVTLLQLRHQHRSDLFIFFLYWFLLVIYVQKTTIGDGYVITVLSEVDIGVVTRRLRHLWHALFVWLPVVPNGDSYCHSVDVPVIIVLF